MVGFVAPCSSIIMMVTVFSIGISPAAEQLSVMNKYVLIMSGLGTLTFVGKFLGSFMWVVIGENMTENIRQRLYEGLLKKHMGWHDEREHSAGAMTSMLAS